MFFVGGNKTTEKKDPNLNNNIITHGINYPVRVHKGKFCNCKRIQKKMFLTKLKPEQKIVYIIEKIWHNDYNKRFPNLILITDNTNDEKNTNADMILHTLFQKSLTSRNYIKKYFKKYEWSFEESITIRSLVRKMSTICFCRDDLLVDKTTCNSGFIIIGNEEQMKKISHCFNKYCQKTEYCELFIIKIANINMIDIKQMGYNLKIFLNSNELKLLDPYLYTLVGKENIPSDLNNITYSFTFGKREWFYGLEETSMECARRELYEEFNIQFSTNLWIQSQTNHPKYIYRPGTMLYFIHLPEHTCIGYHKESDTIYLDC